MTFTQFANFTVKLPPGLPAIKFETLKDMAVPPESHLGDIINQIQAKIGHRDLLWLWVTIGIAGLVSLLLLFWKIMTLRAVRNSKCNCFKTKVQQAKLEEGSQVTSSAPKDYDSVVTYVPTTQEDESEGQVKLYPGLGRDQATQSV